MPYFGNNPSPLLLNTVAQNGKEMTLDADADTSITADTDDQIDIKIGGADDFQFTANTFTAQSGSTIAAQALTATTITASGIVKTDDTTDATTTTDGSLQTDGGLSVVKDAVFGDDVKLLSDSAVLSFGADSEINLTHVADTGLRFEDSDKLIFGAGNDLQIYHDGSNSYIDDAGTGSLFLRSNDIKLHKYTGENLITATADAEVGLYYDDSLKLKTASTGVEIFNGASGQSPHVILKDMNSGVVAGDFGGSLRFSTNDSNAQGVSAVIGSSYANAASGTNLSFFTGTGGNTTEKMRLHTDGCLMLGYNESGLTAPAYTNRAFEAYSSTDNLYMAILHNKSSGSLPYGFYIVYDQAPDNSSANALTFTDGSATRFNVANDGDVKNHDNSYGALSDERIKQDIVDSNSQWNDIKNIKVRNFKRKDDVAQYGDKAWSQIGVVAQEIETVCPNIIRESNPTPLDIKMSSEFGTLYEDGDTIPKGKQIGDVKEIKSKVKSIGYSVLYMKAVKALQEAMARIETLEAKVKTLEEA